MSLGCNIFVFRNYVQIHICIYEYNKFKLSHAGLYRTVYGIPSFVNDSFRSMSNLGLPYVAFGIQSFGIVSFLLMLLVIMLFDILSHPTNRQLCTDSANFLANGQSG